MRISEGLVSGKIIKILPRVYGVVIKDDYERAMLFCRYQEFYESPYDEIRGNLFTLEDFMNLYRKERKTKNFEYPTDWSGYNIPSSILIKASNLFYSSNNINQYDPIMLKIIDYCSNDCDGEDFYLIGTDKSISVIMNHEISHALYYTNIEYKKEANNLISEIKKKDFKFVKDKLLDIGYVDDKKIIKDEMQAFFSTGLYSTFDTEDIKKYTDKFINNFNKYYIK